MKRIVNSIKDFLQTLALCLALMVMLSMCSLVEASHSKSSEVLKFSPANYAKYMRPMKSMKNGRNYCSSSSVNYKGQIVTVTNAHCCNVDAAYGDERRVGNSIETIIHQSTNSDICILTSNQKRTKLKIAKREFKKFQKLIVIGYPWGMYQSISEGRFLHKEKVCYRKDTPGLPTCLQSNIITGEGYPGNSGSPVLNMKGEVVNVLYCGNGMLPNHPCTVRHSDLVLALDVAVLEILNAKN